MINNECFYYDSFGVEIINENIKKFAKIYKKVIYSTECIQGIESRKCGEFCIAFIKNVHCLESYKKFINSFCYNNNYVNDIIVNELLQNNKNIKNILKYFNNVSCKLIFLKNKTKK